MRHSSRLLAEQSRRRLPPVLELVALVLDLGRVDDPGLVFDRLDAPGTRPTLAALDDLEGIIHAPESRS